jgi:hypothetical protein
MTLTRIHSEPEPPPPPPKRVKQWDVEISGYGTVTVDEDGDLRIKCERPAEEMLWIVDGDEFDQLETALRECREQQERQDA